MSVFSREGCNHVGTQAIPTSTSSWTQFWSPLSTLQEEIPTRAYSTIHGSSGRSRVTLVVFNALGEQVATLDERRAGSGPPRRQI